MKRRVNGCFHFSLALMLLLLQGGCRTVVHDHKPLQLAVETAAVTYRCLPLDIPVINSPLTSRATYTEKYYTPGAMGVTIYTNYDLDGATRELAAAWGHCLTLVPPQRQGALIIETWVDDFHGDIWVDTSPSDLDSFQYYDTWRLTMHARVLDPAGKLLAQASSPQKAQRQYSRKEAQSLPKKQEVVATLMTDGLSDLMAKILADRNTLDLLREASGGEGQLLEKAKTAEQRGELREALSLHMEILRQGPVRGETVKPVLRLARAVDPPPAITEEARRRAVFAQTALRNAGSANGIDEAIVEYLQAIRLAPWWADLYVNTALLMEQRKKYADAADMLHLYLEASPGAADRDQVLTKIYELEYGSKGSLKK